jgi:hypothetical protein
MKKKVKRFQGGGLSGIADTANSLIGEVDDMANSIKYGSGARSGQQPLGFLGFNSQKANMLNVDLTSPRSIDRTAIFDPSTSSTTTADMAGKTGRPAGGGVAAFGTFSKLLSGQQTFKKGGKVSSASKRADGIAIRGKTRA